MKIEVTLNMVPDLVAVAALIMLSVYHLMIFWGRRKDSEERYNLYFSAFVATTTLFIIAPYFQPIYFLYSLKPEWLHVINIEALLTLGLFFSGIKFLNRFLRLPDRWKRLFYFTYITMPLNFLLTLTSNFISTAFYFQYILVYVLLIVVLNIGLAYFVYGWWFLKQKLYKQTFFVVLYFGFVALTSNILIYRSIELLNIPRILYLNHYLSAVILYMFAYALSVKFNKEFFELKELKQDLEEKVLTRTEDLRQANELLGKKNIEIEHQKEKIIAINDQLSFRANELSTLDEAKSRFFAGISHEFRTPLTLIISPLESMLIQNHDARLTTEYNLMLRQARRLLELINQLLELAKLQKGLMVLKKEVANFNQLVKTIVSGYSSMAADSNVSLTLIEKCSEQTFSFDIDKVEKIITNLLGNAIKFTPQGGEVAVILKMTSNENSIEVEVHDSGPGIEEFELDNIFNPFYQVDTVSQRGAVGSGIGLALVKELVDLHQGSISVKSEVSKGTVFTFQLPIDHNSTPVDSVDFIELNDHNLDETFANGRQKQGGKKVILLVEDNSDMRLYISTNISDFNVVQAENGQDGLNIAVELVPDLIITDIMMPVMSGLELTARIKQDPRTSHIPIVMLTAKASAESKEEGLQTQADDYITKPFNMTELRLRIKNLIANRQMLKDKFSRSITVNPAELVTTSLDEKFLLKALDVIEQNMDESELSAEIFCEKLAMSRANVHKKLKALTDQSTTEFIRTIRLKRAAQLLKQNAGSISEIAYMTGFNNLSYFTKSFKEQFGTLPSEYNLDN